VTIFGCVLSIDSATVPITEPISDLLKVCPAPNPESESSISNHCHQVFALADQKWESSRIQVLCTQCHVTCHVTCSVSSQRTLFP
jgi:hypothetical protein